MRSLRDQIIENADEKRSRTFMVRLSEECQAMIAEGILLFRHGELPIDTLAELNRSLRRIAEKQYQEDFAKWPSQCTVGRLLEKATDQELQQIVDRLKPKQSKPTKQKTSRTK
jgi:hypothetical protein